MACSTWRVTVTVYNMLGEAVAKLVEGHLSAGYHNVGWTASPDNPSARHASEQGGAPSGQKAREYPALTEERRLKPEVKSQKTSCFAVSRRRWLQLRASS